MSNIPITKETIRQIKTFLTDGKVPTELARSTQFKFKKRYGDGNWTLDGQTLKYQGRNVVPKEDDESTLQRLYDNLLYTQQSGPRFWNRISTEYANISRSDCVGFLENKRVPQMMKKVPKVEVTPINTKYPRHMWNIDFIDLKNSAHAKLGSRYVLTAIDHFSKYAWAFPLKTRDSDMVTEKLRGLFEEGHKPRILHAVSTFVLHTF